MCHLLKGGFLQVLVNEALEMTQAVDYIRTSLLPNKVCHCNKIAMGLYQAKNTPTLCSRQGSNSQP